ncbi:sensor histidine kinase [Roseateles sp. NT4]|uniref:sensor histidine kinase n=1 Tax=Roseateles sp. NT4 TaxID=3453715 RepID=UPI003EEBDAF1
MNAAFLAPRMLRKPMNQYRLGLGLGLTLSVLLMSIDGMESAGLLVCASTTALGLLFAAVMMWRYRKVESPVLLDGGVHPSRGLLSHVPATPAVILLHVLGYAAALALFGAGMLYGPPGAPDPFARPACAAFVIFVLTLLPFELLAVLVVRRWGRTPPRHVVTGLLAVASVFGLLTGIFTARGCLSLLAGAMALDRVWELLVWVPVPSVGVLVMMLWLRDIVVSRWQARLAEQQERASAAERGRQLAEAQLAMLQAQIEPHFLYNTLASLQYLVKRDANAADFLLTQLIRYLRHAMPKMRRPMSTLEQEFELADAFLQIARMRMGGRLTVKVELARDLHELAFPPLVLQTLVENALRHGVEPKLGPVAITVRAVVEPTATGRRLVLDVVDNGVGLGRANTGGSGAGLANIRERLAGIYGERAELMVADVAGGGVMSRVLIVLPDEAPQELTKED